MSWALASEIGYEPKTTFWEDFSIAERFGKDAIVDTAKRAFDEWKNNIEFLTELIMVINHKSWYWSKDWNDEYMTLYTQLYYEYDNKAYEHINKNLSPEDLTYYWRTLD